MLHTDQEARIQAAMRSLLSPFFTPWQAAYGWMGSWLDGPLSGAVNTQQIMLGNSTPNQFSPSPGPLKPTPRQTHALKHALPLMMFSKAGITHQAPRLLFLHGGGWLMGSPGSHAGLMADLALATGGSVVMVDYRLAPHVPIVAALADCWRAFCWLLAQKQQAPLFLVGESAGALMATLIARRAARLGININGQVLICPITDLTRTHPATQNQDFSQTLLNAGIALAKPLWLRNGRAHQARLLSPLLHPVLAHTAPALIITAAQDPLAYDGLAYARHLEQAQIDVTAKQVNAALHGYWSFGRLSAASQGTTKRISQWIIQKSA
jgi:acetyl esterase